MIPSLMLSRLVRIGAHDADLYENLDDLEGVMIQTTREASLRDTSMVGSGGAKDRAESATDARIERVPDVQ